VKRSGRDEPIWVVIHTCIEAMLVVSLHSYLYPKLAKMPCFSFYLTCFFLQRNQRTRGQNRFCLEVGGGEGAQTMYTHVSKCKNDFKKLKINKIKYHFLKKKVDVQGFWFFPLLLLEYLCLPKINILKCPR
jgi:hypothetical protein